MFGVFFACQLGDVVDVQLERDDFVAQRAGDFGDGLSAFGDLVGDEHAQISVVALSHRDRPFQKKAG
jgi:hypothetical protein